MSAIVNIHAIRAIYRFELANQKVEAVSNAVTGLFRPIPRPDGSLIAPHTNATSAPAATSASAG